MAAAAAHAAAAAAAGTTHAGAAAAPAPIRVDGSQLEGGGQILRNAAAIAACTGRAVAVDNIRAGRAKPGLSPQHLTGLRLVAELAGGLGCLQGGAPRSTSVTLAPARRRPAAGGAHVADTGTAGSCTLMVQAALPLLLLGGGDGSDGNGTTGRTTTVTLRGGTDAAFAPPIAYLELVLLPTLRRWLSGGGSGGGGGADDELGGVAASLRLELRKRGFYPRGGGEAVLTARALPPGAALPPLRLTERGRLVRISGFAYTAGRVRPDVGRRAAAAAVGAMRRALAAEPADVVFGRPQAAAAAGTSTPAAAAAAASAVAVDVAARHEPPGRAAGDGGGGVALVAETALGALLGATALFERGAPAEAVGEAAAAELLDALRAGGAVDAHLEDQLVVFAALAGGESAVLVGPALTLHTRTALAVAAQLLQVRFEVAPAPWAAGVAGAASVDVDEGARAPPPPPPPPPLLVRCWGAGVVAGCGGGE